MIEWIDDNSSALSAVYDKYKHLDIVFRNVDESESVFHRTCRDLWIAICDATANATGETERRRLENYERYNSRF